MTQLVYERDAAESEVQEIQAERDKVCQYSTISMRHTKRRCVPYLMSHPQALFSVDIAPLGPCYLPVWAVGRVQGLLAGIGFPECSFLQAIAYTFTVLGDSLTRACEQAISKGEWFGAVARALVQKPQNSCDSGHNEDTDSRGETSVRDSKVVRVERSAGLNPAADHAHPRSYEFQGRVSDSSPSALSP